MPATNSDQSSQPVSAPLLADPTDVLPRRMGAFVLDAGMVATGTLVAAGGAMGARIEDFSTVAESEAWCDTFTAGVGTAQSCLAFDGGSLVYDPSGLWLVIASHFGLWLAMALIEGLTGASIGKRAMGLRVIHQDGSAVRIPAAVLRAVVGIVDALPWGVPMLLGFFFAANSPGRQRLGDRLAGTLVVDRSAVGHAIADLSRLSPVKPYPEVTDAELTPVAAPTDITQPVVPPVAVPINMRWDDTRDAWLFDDNLRSLQWDEATQKWHPQAWAKQSGVEDPDGT